MKPRISNRKIAQKDIEQVKRYLTLDHEICGLIRPIRRNDSSVLGLNITDRGESIEPGERGSCVSTNVWMNYHTHPRLVLPWPSTEDVFKILYDREDDPVLWGCLIFTEWGVWELYAPKKESVSQIHHKEKEWTQETSDVLYYDLNLERQKRLPSLKEAQTYVLKYIKKWKTRFRNLGLQMTLTSWSRIQGGYTFRTGLGQVPPFREER
jgi:hypothetical protein